ncbi:MAG: CDP-alcohol phosphatidyltransferase family protein, partial [Candidatus Dormibacteria bacterium]
RHAGRYGIPNGLTALRAWFCLPLILDASLRLPGELALILWCSTGFAAGMLDYVDGLIARRVGPITELGRAMDPAMDSLFFSMAAVGNLELGIVPPWLTVVLLVRYLGPFLLTPLVLLAGRRPELVHTAWGRRNTALVGLTLFACMWTRIFRGPVDLVALAVGLPLVVPTMLLHFINLARRTAASPRVTSGALAELNGRS